MLWQGRRESENVEDVRGSGGRRLAVGGGIGGVIVVVAYLLLGGDPLALLESQQQAQISQSGQIDSQAPRDEASKFVAVVLADTEDAWNQIFWPGFGPAMPTESSGLSKPAISKRRCARPPRLAMTDSKADRAVTSCPIHLRTALPNNASAGSAAATRPAISARATRLTRLTCNKERRASGCLNPRLTLFALAVVAVPARRRRCCPRPRLRALPF